MNNNLIATHGFLNTTMNLISIGKLYINQSSDPFLNIGMNKWLSVKPSIVNKPLLN